jgi:predicted DNA binding CopG/RHH family protein
METILVSALVAGFTTLAIEYFAKPSLEKRKTRILAEFKLQQELDDWIGKVNFQVGAWEFHVKESEFIERRDELFILIQQSVREYPIETLSKQLGLNQHVYEIVSHLLSSLEAWEKMLDYGASSEELDKFLTQKVLPLFELAEDAINGYQVRWLPKLKLRKAFRTLSA